MNNKIDTNILDTIIRDDIINYRLIISDFDINSEYDSSNMLELAISYGATNIALYLLSKNINIHHRDKNGLTSLHVCSWYFNKYNCLEIAQALIDSDVEIDAIDKYGNTPLWYAVHFSTLNIYKKDSFRYNLVKLLVDTGANPLHLNNVKRTPVDLATIHNDSYLLELLSNHARNN